MTIVTEALRPARYTWPMKSNHKEHLQQQYQRAHENLSELQPPSASDRTEKAHAVREAIRAEQRVIRLCAEALGWFRAA